MANSWSTKYTIENLGNDPSLSHGARVQLRALGELAFALTEQLERMTFAMERQAVALEKIIQIWEVDRRMPSLNAMIKSD